MKFLLDTNFLLIPGRFGVDVFSELSNFGRPECYTLQAVLAEMEKLTVGHGADAKAAKLGLELLGVKGVIILASGAGPADVQIQKAAENEGYVVCTQDAELAKKLKAAGVKVVMLRHKKYLEIA